VSFSSTLSGSADAFDENAYALNFATLIRMPVTRVRTAVTRRRVAGRRLQVQDKPTFWEWMTRRGLQDDAESFDVLAQFGTDLFADAQSAFDTLSPLLNDPTMKAQLACALGVCGQILSTSALQMLVADQADEYENGSGSGSGIDEATVEPPSSPPPSPPSDDGAASGIAIAVAVVVIVGAILLLIGFMAGCFNGLLPRVGSNAVAPAPPPPTVSASAGGGKGTAETLLASSAGGNPAAAASATQPLLGGRLVHPGRKARYQQFKVSF
jgi:hypothetical protein